MTSTRRRRRCWNRPLAAGVTLVLVAALAPRAVADEGDTTTSFQASDQGQPPPAQAPDQTPTDVAAADPVDGPGTAGVPQTQDPGGGGEGSPGEQDLMRSVELGPPPTPGQPTIQGELVAPGAASPVDADPELTIPPSAPTARDGDRPIAHQPAAAKPEPDLAIPAQETAAQQPAAVAGDGDAHVVTVGILPAPDQGGEALPQLPSVVAEARPEPAGGQTAASRQAPDRTDQDEPAAGAGGCAGGGCSNEPPTPAGPTAAAADDPVSRFVARLLQAAGLGRGPAQRPAPEQPPQDPPQQPEPEPAQRPELTLADIARIMRDVEAGLLQGRSRIRTTAELASQEELVRQVVGELMRGGSDAALDEVPFDHLLLLQRALIAEERLRSERRAAEEPTRINWAAWNLDDAEGAMRQGAAAEPGPARDRWADSARRSLDRASRTLSELGSQVASPAPPAPPAEEELLRRTEELRRQLGGENAMSVVDSDAPTPGQPATKGRQVVVLTAAGFPVETDVPGPTGFGGDDTRAARTVTPASDAAEQPDLRIPASGATRVGPVIRGLILAGAVAAAIGFAVMQGMSGGTLRPAGIGPLAPDGLLAPPASTPG